MCNVTLSHSGQPIVFFTFPEFCFYFYLFVYVLAEINLVCEQKNLHTVLTMD